MHIPIVLGTARANRESEAVANAVVGLLEDIDDVSTELVDVREHITEAVTVPPWGEGGASDSPTKWKKIAEKANAFILVIPEYNRGYPGELKLLLDSLWDEYEGKKVGLVGVSNGTLGGARVVDHIKPVLIELKLTPVRESVYVSKVKEAVTDDGEFADEKTVAAVEKLVATLRE